MTAKLQDARQGHRLDSLFRPRSIALVGATERSMWSNSAYGNLVRYGYEGDIYLVNPKGGTIYKREAFTSCAAIGKPVDLALLMVPEAAIEAAFDDMLAARVRNAVILSAGFAETGADGIQRQAAMTAKARAADMRLLGPNCLGFVNYVHKVPVWTNVRRRQSTPGAVAIVSQSGAAANHMGDFAFRQNIPLSLMISTGNESDVDVAGAIEYLVAEPHTKAIAVFLETVRDSSRFMRAAQAARAAAKPIVVLKVGASDIAAKAAAAHTGALVGDDRVFGAACVKFGMVRVTSPERLILTADLLSRLPPMAGRKLAFSSLSGGMCGIGADQATASGLDLPAFSADTAAALRTVMPAYSAAQNPLDFTGAAVLDPSIMERALVIIAKDPAVAMLACLLDAPEGDDATGFLEKALQAMGRGFAATKKPCVVFSNTQSPVSKVGRETADAAGVVYSGAGIELGLAALAGAARWWGWTDRAVLPPAAVASAATMPRGERESLDHLARYGVPVIPAKLVTSAQPRKIPREQCTLHKFQPMGVGELVMASPALVLAQRVVGAPGS